jgi:hypothetical protein
MFHFICDDQHDYLLGTKYFLFLKSIPPRVSERSVKLILIIQTFSTRKDDCVDGHRKGEA